MVFVTIQAATSRPTLAARCIDRDINSLHSQVKQRLDALIEEYRQRFGVVVGTDLVRELFPDYTASLENRLTFAVAVQRSAAHIAERFCEEMIQNLKRNVAENKHRRPL